MEKIRERIAGGGIGYAALFAVIDESGAKLELVVNAKTYVFDGIVKSPVSEHLKKPAEEPLITKDKPYVNPVKKNYSFNGLWYCRSSHKFIGVVDHFGTVYDAEGKDLGFDKVEIDDRGFAGISYGFLDYCWGGNEQFVKGTKIPWPRGKDFEAYTPHKQI